MSKYAIVPRAEFILSEESAVAEVVRLLTYYDIDVETISDAESKAAFERSLDALTKYVRTGTVEVTEDADSRLSVVQHLPSGATLTYGELGAKHKLAMDRVPREESYKRIYALMGSLCGLGPTAIEKLSAKDLAVVEVLGTVFSNA